MAEADSEKRYRANWRSEADGAALYRALADAEANPQLAQVYRRLAAVEDAHADFWKTRLGEIGARLPVKRTGWRTRALSFFARRFGPGFVLPIINRLERTGSAQYDNQQDAVGAGMPADERAHARLLNAIASPPGGMQGGTLAQLEGRHRASSGGNALRAAVLGANDGLVSNLSLVMGVAGADLAPHAILITGLAGLLAGACSMAMGEWLSVTSSRELYEQQIATEARELEEMPAEEEEELALIYQAKGLGAEEAKALAHRLISNKSTALETLTREELGIDPKELGGSPMVAAATSFVLFAIGAAIPVIPFAVLPLTPATVTSIGASLIVMFLLGAGITVLTGRNALWSGLRQMAIGIAAAGVTYGLGKLIGGVIT